MSLPWDNNPLERTETRYDIALFDPLTHARSTLECDEETYSALLALAKRHQEKNPFAHTMKVRINMRDYLILI